MDEITIERDGIEWSIIELCGSWKYVGLTADMETIRGYTGTRERARAIIDAWIEIVRS